MVRLDSGDADGVVAKAGGQQSPHDTQGHATSLWRQAAHMVHVFVVAPQRLIHRCRPRRWRGNHALGAQDNQQMAQRSAQTAPVALNRSRAVASRKMFVKELGDDRLVDASDAQAATGNPLSKVSETADAVGKGGRSIASVSQVLLERVKMRRDRPLVEPV